MKRRIPILLLITAASFNAWGAAIFDISGTVDWTSWSVSQNGTDLALVPGSSVYNYTHAHVADQYATYLDWGSNSARGQYDDPWQDVSIGFTTPLGSAAASLDSDSMDVAVSGTNYFTNTASGFLDTGSIAQRSTMRYRLDSATNAITISADYAMNGDLRTDTVGDTIYASNTFFDITAILQDAGGNSIMDQVNAEYRPNYRVEDGEDLIFADSGTLSLALDPTQYQFTPVYVWIRAELRAYGDSVTEEGTPVPVTADVPAPAPLALMGLGLIGMSLVRKKRPLRNRR